MKSFPKKIRVVKAARMVDMILAVNCYVREMW